MDQRIQIRIHTKKSWIRNTEISIGGLQRLLDFMCPGPRTDRGNFLKNRNIRRARFLNIRLPGLDLDRWNGNKYIKHESSTKFTLFLLKWAQDFRHIFTCFRHKIIEGKAYNRFFTNLPYWDQWEQVYDKFLPTNLKTNVVCEKFIYKSPHRAGVNTWSVR